MAIFNESYINEFFGFGKKNNKNKNKTYEKKNDKPTITPYTDEEIEKVETELKKIVQKYNTDPKIKEEVLKLTADWYDSYPDESYCKRSEFVKFYNFKCKLTDWCDNYSPAFEICDRDQGYRVAVSDIIVRIANDLKHTLNDEYAFTIGEGDEGCIYM